MVGNIRLLNSWSFRVYGRPIPWSTPDVGVSKGRRFAKKNPALTQWQKIVNEAAVEAYGHREPHAGPIYIAIQFFLECRKYEAGRSRQIVIPCMTWDENQARFRKQGGLPDRTNLLKGVEDALEGVFYVNDTQVRAGSDSCMWHTDPGCQITVGFIDPSNPNIGVL